MHLSLEFQDLLVDTFSSIWLTVNMKQRSVLIDGLVEKRTPTRKTPKVVVDA